MSALPPRGEHLFPVLTGALLVTAFPPFALLLPSFIALVPLLVFVAERQPGPAGRWAAARGGFLAGLVYFGLLLYWMVVALVFYSALAIPAYLLTTTILAGFVAVFAWLLHFVREHGRVPLVVAAPVLWTAAEWVQGNLGDLSFPWLGLGSSLAAYPVLAGAADLVGSRGLTLWLAAVNALVAEAVLRARAGRPVLQTAVATVAVAAMPALYGWWRAETLEMRPAARVAVVQPNIPEDLKLDRAQALDSSLASLRRLMAQIEPGSVDVVVWPEVTLPAALQHPAEAGLVEAVREMSAQVRAPIIAGAYGLGGGSERPAIYNSAFMVTEGGLIGYPYSKIHLVPFVERVPFIDPSRLEALVGELRYFGALSPGEDTPIMVAAGASFGILICYESAFAALARQYRRAGTDYLVNMTNDAWYGREAWYGRTTALWQHPAHLVMRAIEQRVGVARAANTGISMFVDPVGRTYERTPLFEPAVRVATVYTTDVVTLYARWGDWVGSGATLLAVVLVTGAWLAAREAAAPARGARFWPWAARHGAT